MRYKSQSTGKKNKRGKTPIKSLREIVKRTRIAQEKWRNRTIDERIQIIQRLTKILQKNRINLGGKIKDDIGKPLKKAISEVDRAMEITDFFCKKAPEFLKEKRLDLFHDRVVFDPLGIVAVIAPWNYPLSTSFLSVIPALLCGNGVILKSSEYSSSTGKMIENIFRQIKTFPDDLFSVIVGGPELGKSLIKQDIDLVSFTGSTKTGKEIMKNSSTRLHKLIFELGGLDAAIVLKDANLKKAVKKIIGGNMNNSGQACDAIKRVYVENMLYDDFVREAAIESKKITIGSPNDDVEMGPIVSEKQIKKLEDMIKDAVKKGAKVMTGGKRLNRKGYYFPHTVIIDVTNDMDLMREEPFGPILPIMKVNSWKEAVELANDTRYGLTASVWTKNTKLGERIARMLEVGVVGINCHGEGPLGTPWGGTKESGFGRLGSKEGFRSFTNIKLIRKFRNPS